MDFVFLFVVLLRSGPLYARGASKDLESKYVPGTTWVFDDEEEPKHEDMSIDDFASQFDMASGGEAFRVET